MPLDGSEAKPLRHAMEDQRRIGAEPGLPPEAETGAGSHHTLMERARLFRWSMKGDGFAASHQMDFGSTLMEKRGDIDGRGTRSDHSHFASLKDTQIVMMAA